MYQTILFDLDGTLTDPKEGITKCFQYALSAFGVQESLDRLNRVIGPPLIDSFRDFYGFNERDGLAAVEKYRERFRTIGIYENRVYPGVEKMLQSLKVAGRTIALATSKPYVFARQILDHYQLTPYFDVVCGAELDGRRNYKKDVIAYVFEQLALTEAERALSVMVGDRRQDIEGAKQCGIASVGVGFGYAEEGELESAGADCIVASVQELTAALLSKNGGKA